MRYFDCHAVEVGSTVGRVIVTGERSGVDSGGGVEARNAGVTRGGGVSGVLIGEGAAADGAPHAPSAISTRSSIPGEVFKQPDLAASLYREYQGWFRDVSETRGKFQVTEPIPTHRPVYVRVIDLNLEAYGMIRSSSVQGQVEVEFSRPPTHMARFLLNEKL